MKAMTTKTERPYRRPPSLSVVALALIGLVSISTARAQDDDIAPDLQCLRYVQAYERSLQIPAGLLTAIAFVEAGRPTTDGKTVAWPWTINVGGQGQFFNSKAEAVAAARKLLDEGDRSIDVGCLQVNLRYHPNAFRSLDDAFDPSTNAAYGAQFLKSLHELQGSWPQAIERYHSSDDARRNEYRDRVLAFWNNQARQLVMDTVLAEDTDTPYHRAIRDFAAGRFAAALDKYEAIVDQNPKDRLGLLGLAMSYERLNRASEAAQAYARYLAVEPGNDSVASHLLQTTLALPPADARQQLEMFVKTGANRPEFLAALADLAATSGDTMAALTFAVAAVSGAPTVAMYQLNAAVLADRLKRKDQALAYYQGFLNLFARNPVTTEASIPAVKNRVRYLQTL